METDYTKIDYTFEWFRNPENQAHTIQDILDFKIHDCRNIIHIGDHFLLDLYPTDYDVEIWEVENTKKKRYDKMRKGWFNFKPIRKITMGKQFKFPNGYWRVKEG